MRRRSGLPDESRGVDELVYLLTEDVRSSAFQFLARRQEAVTRFQPHRLSAAESRERCRYRYNQKHRASTGTRKIQQDVEEVLEGVAGASEKANIHRELHDGSNLCERAAAAVVTWIEIKSQSEVVPDRTKCLAPR